jgi:hypothetical protein
VQFRAPITGQPLLKSNEPGCSAVHRGSNRLIYFSRSYLVTWRTLHLPRCCTHMWIHHRFLQLVALHAHNHLV